MSLEYRTIFGLEDRSRNYSRSYSTTVSKRIASYDALARDYVSYQKPGNYSH